jgi:tetratricopeptide (TPR) repeat protein
MASHRGAIVSITDVIAAPIAAMVEHWQELGAGAACDPAVLVRQGALLELLVSLVSQQRVEPLRSALATGDQNAMSALCRIDNYIGDACKQVLERAKRDKLGGAWSQLDEDASLASRLAVARGDRGEIALAFFLLANARRGMGDTFGTATFYERAIAAAEGQPDASALLAAAHDNVGNALAELGRFDDALDHYRRSLSYEPNRDNVQTILANQAHCQLMLGEFKAAGQTLTNQLKELEVNGVSGSKLGMAMDMAAQMMSGVSESEAALDMLQRARTVFPPGDLKGRAINAILISQALKESRDETRAAQAFQEAHDLAIESARQTVNIAYYERGFVAALAKSVRPEHQAIQLFLQAIYAKEHDDPGGAFNSFQEAANLARAADDTRLALRIKVNAAALLADLGQVDEAVRVASEVQTEAAENGLALPEMMALGNLASLAAAGADIRDVLGPLGPLARVVVLREVHNAIVAKQKLNPAESKFETTDTGATANELGSLAQNHCAYQLAADYFLKAIGIAKSLNMRFELVNRLAGLLAVRVKLKEDTDAVAAELSALVDAGNLPLRGEIVAGRALGAHFAETDRPLAVTHLRKALGAAEQIRSKLPPGPDRAGFDRQFRDIPYRLSEVLLEQRQDEAAFDALQQTKGRRLIEALAAEAGHGNVLDTPLTAQEAYRLTSRAGAGTTLVDLLVGRGALTAFVLAHGQLKTIHVEGDESALRDAEKGDVQEREARAVSLCLGNKLLRELAEGVCSVVPRGTPLMIVADQLLHNLPLHAIPVEGAPWADRMPISYAPTAAVLRFNGRAGGDYTSALVAGDSRRDLPGAAEECELISSMLNTKPLIGSDCTHAALEQALHFGKPEIVHLALHGRGDPQHGGRSSLLLADGNGDVQWVDFQSLTNLRWATRLVVFSGCSTGLLGRRHGYELLSVANAALEAGARSVIASLWPVEDLYAKAFMTAFYRALRSARQSGPVDLRLILDSARRSTMRPARPSPQSKRRDGRNRHFGWTPGEEAIPAYEPAVADALEWAPFCLFGAPIFEN